jgi:pimeloyl-ACP methyl ester carboxylesterase
MPAADRFRVARHIGSLLRAGTVLVAVLIPLGVAAAAPCATATDDCTEWLAFGGGAGRSRLYRSHPLSRRNDQITRALVVVHGMNRDADAHFRTGMAAARLAGTLDSALIIAPRFASNDGGGCRDRLAAIEINWPCTGNSWRSGGVADGGKVTSFDLADAILHLLARKDVFPNLKSVVVAGHSAGGQFVTRYEMANRVHETLGIAISYVVANPSSYAYLDPTRPIAESGRTEFRAFGRRDCVAYDRWPYGLGDRTGYAARLSAGQLKKQLAVRPTTYLVGGRDVLPVAGFDSSCAAMAQGPTRLARGQAFATYVKQKFGAKHTVTIVPQCGHDARCMFTADAALPLLFP